MACFLMDICLKYRFSRVWMSGLFDVDGVVCLVGVGVGVDMYWARAGVRAC
jgi:hypothetical protein